MKDQYGNKVERLEEPSKLRKGMSAIVNKIKPKN